MTRPTSQRILIVGGGISGLSIAVRLAQAALPVTVLEASQLGYGASTRNQGWLYSGAWFAPQQPELARMAYRSLQQTLAFCPECVEPDSGPMVYLMAEADTDPSLWTLAWDAAGIPYRELPSAALFERLPTLAISQARAAFELPDRAMRTDLLLARMAEAALGAGAEIRSGTTAARLIARGDFVTAIETEQGEVLEAGLVILAGNTKGPTLLAECQDERATADDRPEVELEAVKTHLVAVRPEISRAPICVVDAGGFNHIPHRPNSVLGSNRWLPVRPGEEGKLIATEIEHIWSLVQRFFPDFRRQQHTVVEWAGDTVQALPAGQSDSTRPPLPTVIDHQHDSRKLMNVLSVFPGRASLWPQLAEQAREIVLRKMSLLKPQVAAPPWHAAETSPAELPPAPSAASKLKLYHCQRCGNVVAREPELAPPACCDEPMSEAGQRAPDE